MEAEQKSNSAANESGQAKAAGSSGVLVAWFWFASIRTVFHFWPVFGQNVVILVQDLFIF